jgi:hypothetical protein
MFKRKITLKKARKLADCVPLEIRQEMEILTDEFHPIVSTTMPILKLGRLTKNLRNYGNIEDAVHAYNK